MTTETLSKIIAAVGPAVPELSSILKRGEDEWLFSFVDLDVSLEYDPEMDRIMLSGDSDPLPQANREAVLTTLLTYSFLWRDTGALYLALRSTDKPVLMLPLSGSEVDTELLTIVLPNFANKIRDISSLITSMSTEQRKNVPATDDHIRV